MALTFTKQDAGVMGDKRYWLGTVAFDSSYPAGGEAVAASDFQFSTAIEGVLVGAGSALVFGLTTRWDPSTSKLTLGDETAADGIQVQATGDQSAVVDVQVLAFGY